LLVGSANGCANLAALVNDGRRDPLRDPHGSALVGPPNVALCAVRVGGWSFLVMHTLATVAPEEELRCDCSPQYWEGLQDALGIAREQLELCGKCPPADAAPAEAASGPAACAPAAPAAPSERPAEAEAGEGADSPPTDAGGAGGSGGAAPAPDPALIGRLATLAVEQAPLWREAVEVEAARDEKEAPLAAIDARPARALERRALADDGRGQARGAAARRRPRAGRAPLRTRSARPRAPAGRRRCALRRRCRVARRLAGGCRRGGGGAAGQGRRRHLARGAARGGRGVRALRGGPRPRDSALGRAQAAPHVRADDDA
jgi:hypothetical protein